MKSRGSRLRLAKRINKKKTFMNVIITSKPHLLTCEQRFTQWTLSCPEREETRKLEVIRNRKSSLCSRKRRLSSVWNKRLENASFPVRWLSNQRSGLATGINHQNEFSHDVGKHRSDCGDFQRNRNGKQIDILAGCQRRYLYLIFYC